MLPHFPHETPLLPEHREAIERYTSAFEPYSDIQFGSLWAWDVDESVRVSELNGNLVLRLKDYGSDEQFYTLVGEREIASAACAILEQAGRLGISQQLRLVPESVVTAVRRWPDAFGIAEDRANHDYILSNKEWAILDGHGYAAHRTKVNRFRRQTDVEERALDLCCGSDRRELVQLFDRWAASKSGDAIDRDLERRSLFRLFAPVTATRASGIGLYERGRMIGFSLWEGLPYAGCSLHHFMKTDCSYPGLSSYLMQRRAYHLIHAGYPMANIEQDLGIPGLAAFKQSLRPSYLLRKFTIAPASGQSNER
jgi:hypothetical protein